MIELTSLTFDPQLFYFTLIALTALAVLKAGNTKTFYIQKYNNEGEPLQEEFELYKMSNDELLNFLRKSDAKGLVLIDNSRKEPVIPRNEPVITSLEDVIPNGYYQIRKNITTFYVQKYSNEGEPLENEFEQFNMRGDNEFFNFLRRTDARGLVLIGNSKPVITSLACVIPNGHYQISANHLLAIKRGDFWTQVEDVVNEDETLLAIKGFLTKKFDSPIETFPRTMYKNKIPIMEWDGVLTCNDMIYLLECKHKMTEDHIKNIVNRLDKFLEKVEETDTIEFKQLIGKQCIGVACGSYFPEELRNRSINEFGLAIVYPSGDRYKVEVSENFSNK